MLILSRILLKKCLVTPNSPYLSFMSFHISPLDKQCNGIKKTTTKMRVSCPWSYNNKISEYSCVCLAGACVLGRPPLWFEQQEVTHVQSWTSVSHDWLQILTAQISWTWSRRRREAEDETCGSRAFSCTLTASSLTSSPQYGLFLGDRAEKQTHVSQYPPDSGKVSSMNQF